MEGTSQFVGTQSTEKRTNEVGDPVVQNHEELSSFILVAFFAFTLKLVPLRM